MRLDDICRHLDTEFAVNDWREAWPELGRAGVDVRPFASEQFLAHGNGLLVRASDDIAEVYTAVFPSPAVLDYLASRAFAATLLVCHYPLHFDGYRGYLALTADLLAQLRERGVSLYCLHAPLQRGERISTCRSLARALGLRVEGTFEGPGGQVGCYGLVEVEEDEAGAFAFSSMVLRVEERLEITNSQVVEHLDRAVGRVALVPGDGADPDMLDAADAHGCHTYITGILDNPVADPAARARSQAFLSHAAERAINLIGASQYATAMPAMRVLATWFQALGLPAEPIADAPELKEFLTG